MYNRTRQKSEALSGDGARVAESPAEACWSCEAVLTMLAGVHISSSTIGTALARRLAAEHASRGQDFVSAPVFGRPDAAEARRLIVVAAGRPESIERFRPVFDALGRQTFVAGAQPWQANAVKLCGNFMIAAMLEAFAEAFATLRKAGVDPPNYGASWPTSSSPPPDPR